MKCKKCGKSFEGWLFINGTCPQCREDLMEPTVKVLGEAPVHCHRVILGIGHVNSNFDQTKIMCLGDLYVTIGGLAYIPYHCKKVAKDSAERGLALLVGGPALAIAYDKTNSKSPSEIESLATRNRELFYGVSVEDRLRENSLLGYTMSKSDVRNIKLSDDRKTIA